jgi:hypothetical protein
MLELGAKVTLFEIVHPKQRPISIETIGSAYTRLVLVGKDANGKPRQFDGKETLNGFYYGIGDMRDFTIRAYQEGDENLIEETLKIKEEENRKAREIHEGKILERKRREENRRQEIKLRQEKGWERNKAAWESRETIVTSQGGVTIVRDITNPYGDVETLFINFVVEKEFDWEKTTDEAKFVDRVRGSYSSLHRGFSSGSISPSATEVEAFIKLVS